MKVSSFAFLDLAQMNYIWIRQWDNYTPNKAHALHPVQQHFTVLPSEQKRQLPFPFSKFFEGIHLNSKAATAA